ncbi:Fe-Mn family superoxide dismutase [Bacillus ectoiniformans]|uniref:superoxide dismutase n=1 Tax=Bacillus ectoiniformans TaxID=1494429 RepID=UPI001EF86DAC|nr:superoxide dismutase [Bacillus ectoiniformans]MBM7647379.1 Fe-Mn family superoxide dismutase [Bacillus ectoiniformans]
MNKESYVDQMKQWTEDLLKQQETFIDLCDQREHDKLAAWKERVEKFRDSLNDIEDIEGEQLKKMAEDLYLEGEQVYTGISFTQPFNELDLGEVQFAERQMAVPIGQHKLPPLPYPYNALEPHIDQKTMRLHHDKHHRSYVEGLNKAEKALQQARLVNDYQLIKHWERELAFHGAGHYLHTIFWEIMCPEGGGKPSGELLQEINDAFGSFAQFQKQFSEAAKAVEGSGWAILVWAPRAHRLEILQAEKHQNLSQWDVIPLLVLDVWEHAYYLKHQNNRAGYVEAWWNVVCWKQVTKRFNEAKKLKWKPY